MYQNRCMDMSGIGHKSYDMKEMPSNIYDGGKEHHEHGMKIAGMHQHPMQGMACPPMHGTVCPPIIECPQVRCVHREIIHEVPHIQPIETKIINHHIYRHTLTPTFSCCEENVCSNVFEPPRCGF